jgi:hypothetical protein
MAFDFMDFDLNQDLAKPPVDPFVDKNGRPLNQGDLEAPKPEARRPQFLPQRTVRPLGVQPMDFASMGPMGQAASLNGMVGGVNDLVDREMGSRVMQAREERQRQHEKELMAMRMQAMKAQNEGDIIRSLLNG